MPIISNNSANHHNVSVDNETSFGKNALEAKIYSGRVDDVLANPKINQLIK